MSLIKKESKVVSAKTLERVALFASEEFAKDLGVVCHVQLSFDDIKIEKDNSIKIELKLEIDIGEDRMPMGETVPLHFYQRG